MSGNNIESSQGNTIPGVCDETQPKEYQDMYVFVAEKENLAEVVEKATEETSKAEQKIQTALYKSFKCQKKPKKSTEKDFMLKWAQKERERLYLEIKFMKEEHKLQMEKLKLEIERLSES